MTAGRIKDAIAAALFLGLIGLWGYYELIEKPRRAEVRRAVAKEQSSARFDAWAYVAREKSLSATETIRLVIIPHPSGIELLDTKCFLYTHADFRQSQLTCPDARQQDIEE